MSTTADSPSSRPKGAHGSSRSASTSLTPGSVSWHRNQAPDWKNYPFEEANSLVCHWSLAVKLEKPKLLPPLPQVDGLSIYIPIPGLPLAKVLSLTWPFATPLR